MSIENSPHVNNVRLISFSSIISNSYTVVRVSSDRLVFAIDLVMALTGKNKDKANQSLRSISDEDFHLENYVKRPISGSTQFNKLVTFQHAIDLVMLVPCMKLSADTRIQFANVIKKLMDDYVPAHTIDADELNPRTMISFADVVEGRNAFVRVTADKMIYAVDLVMVVTGLSRDDSGKTLRRLPDEIFPSDKLSERTLPGKGNAHTKLVSLQNAIELIMVLPGKLAKEIRVQFATIIRRYMAGDQSLVGEIEVNAQDASPIAQMARETLGDVQEDQGHKRRRQMEDVYIRTQSLSYITSGMFIMNSLNPNWRNNTSLVTQLEDQVTSILTSADN
jgi:hypothetical protein